jgi:hypothetical protein
MYFWTWCQNEMFAAMARGSWAEDQGWGIPGTVSSPRTAAHMMYENSVLDCGSKETRSAHPSGLPRPDKNNWSALGKSGASILQQLHHQHMLHAIEEERKQTVMLQQQVLALSGQDIHLYPRAPFLVMHPQARGSSVSMPTVPGEQVMMMPMLPAGRQSFRPPYQSGSDVDEA